MYGSLPDKESSTTHSNTPPPQQQGTVLSGSINLINTVIGTGLLGLPGALGGTGYMGGILLMLAGAGFSVHGLALLSEAAQRPGCGLPHSSFYTVARAATGPSGTALIDAAVAIKCFGVATGYLITVGDCLSEVVKSVSGGDVEGAHALWLSRRLWVVGATLAVLPVSFYRTLDELKRAGALALVFVLALVLGIVAYAQGWAGDPCGDDLDTAASCRGPTPAFTDAPQTLAKLPIFVFAFTCHQNIFPIVNEMRERSRAKVHRVIIGSIGLALLAFLLVGLEGYRTFGTNVQGDILLNYPATAQVTGLRLCIALMLTLHYPLQLDPSRRCVLSLVRAWRSTTEKEYDSSSLFVPVTVAFLVASFTTAVVVDDLGVVMALVGATGSTLVSYILPGFLYVRIHPVWDFSRVAACGQLLVGCIIMPVALYFILIRD